MHDIFCPNIFLLGAWKIVMHRLWQADRRGFKNRVRSFRAELKRYFRKIEVP